MAMRVLHVDDDRDIREIVKFSLQLDPIFEVTSCASGEDAIAISTDCEPDLVLCDVMMPGMDGPAVLKRLRESPMTAKTPVLFMTARAQTQDVQRFKELGAAGVITKPFDPMKLTDTVRGHLSAIKCGVIGDEFALRLRSDADALKTFRQKLQNDPSSSVVLESIRSCAHKLAGTAGIFNFRVVSSMASNLEEAIVERCAGENTPNTVESKLDALLQRIEVESMTVPSVVNARQ